MKKKLIDRTADVKVEAGYHDMTDQEKEIYDKILVAQWETMKEKGDKMNDKINMAGKKKEDWDKMTDDKKEEAMGKMKGMKDMFDGKREELDKKDMEFRNQANYKDMKEDARNMFDKKLSERRDRMDSNSEAMFDKFSEAKGKMSGTDEEMKKHINEKIEDMKMKKSRDQDFEDHDF
jgi:hypothetical protein